MSHNIKSKQQLIALDEARDKTICGASLLTNHPTRFANEGAHDPTATFYFVLEKLFNLMEFDEHSWLLDVGCSAGRTLAYFAESHTPGKATGIELDPELAHRCQSWTPRFPNLEALQGNALNLPLYPYTHFYLFNPFDSRILSDFVSKIESEVTQPITFCHMSDNGEYYLFWGREGWELYAAGEIEFYEGVTAYDYPQHYSIWRFDPAATAMDQSQ